MLGQTFVCHDNLLLINGLRLHSHLRYRLENPSESLVESGLRHSGGKTFRGPEEDSIAPSRNYVCDQSAARASAGGIDRNSTPTR